MVHNKKILYSIQHACPFWQCKVSRRGLHTSAYELSAAVGSNVDDPQSAEVKQSRCARFRGCLTGPNTFRSRECLQARCVVPFPIPFDYDYLLPGFYDDAAWYVFKGGGFARSRIKTDLRNICLMHLSLGITAYMISPTLSHSSDAVRYKL